MTQLETKPDLPKMGSRRGSILGLAAGLAVILVVGIVLITSDGDAAPDPSDAVGSVGEATESLAPGEALLVQYALLRNAGNTDSYTDVFDPRAEQKRHPSKPWDGGKRWHNDPLGYLNGLGEIRMIDGEVAAIQGSGSGVEFFDVKVNENAVTTPNVTFRWRFHYGADGIESGGEAGCFGGEKGGAFIENGKITVFDWGFEDPTACIG